MVTYKKGRNMNLYGTKHLAYRPYLASNGGNREIVFQKTIEYKNGKILHNEDGPAVMWSDGSKEYYYNGKLHREDGPAVIENGKDYVREIWLIHGQKHRVGGPTIDHKNNNDSVYQEYYHENKLHREDGPAVIHPTGTSIWYKNGAIDRVDGPAIVNMSGSEIIGNQWFINNRDVTKLYRRWANRRKIEMNGENFSIFRIEYRLTNGNPK